MTSSLVSKRLFIGGLANDISEAELLDKFSRFGKVSDLSVKHRKEDSGIIHKSFAHLNIEGEEANIKKCFATYQNTKWKGSVLTLQYAKESFLNKLVKEREEEKLSKEEKRSQGSPPPPVSTWEPPKFDKPQGSAVPGTPIPGKPDWIVGKYGRVLPVLKLKKSSKLKVVKHDPSKLCHTARVFKENTSDPPASVTCDTLTWEIDQPDSEIVKKMKGIFPKPAGQQKKKTAQLPTDLSWREKSTSGDSSQGKPLPKKVMVKKEEFEIVPLGTEPSAVRSQGQRIESNKFDSDVGSDDECAFSEPQPNIQRKNIKAEPKKPAVRKVAFKKSEKESEKTKTQKRKLSDDVDSDPDLDERDRQPLLDYKDTNCKRGRESEDESDDSMSKSLDTTKFKSPMKSPRLGSNKKKVKRVKKEKTENEDSDEDDGDVPVPKFAGLGILSPEAKVKSLGDNDGAGYIFQNSNLRLENNLKNDPDELSENTWNTKFNSVNDSILAVNDKKSKCKKSEKCDDGSSSDENGPGELSENSFNTSQSSKFNSVIDSILVVNNKKKKGKKRKKRGDDDSSSDDNCLVPKFGGLNMLYSNSHGNEHGKNMSSDNSKSSRISVQVTQVGHEPSKLSDIQKKVTHRDSDSSAGTDEIILRCKSQHSHKSSASTTKTDVPSPAKPADVSLASDQNLLLSELFTSAPDISETPIASTAVPTRSSASDSYDSDLDSNDFELVAKKLAQKAAKKTVKVFPKGINSSDASPRRLTSTPNETSAKPERKKLLSNGDSGSTPEVQIKQPQKQLTGDERRLQALKERMKQKQQQAQIVQAALHNVDNKDNNKRKVFSSDEEEQPEESSGVTDSGTSESPKKKSSDTKQLFDSDSDSSDDDDTDMFKSRPHLEGKKGEKLMKLERRFGDSRFKLDAKFAESDSEGEPAVSEKVDDDKEVVDELAAERDANLKVLEKVVGKATLDQFSQKIKRNTKQMIDMNTVRFDPTKLALSDSTQDDKSRKSSKLQIKDESNEKVSTKVSDKKDKKKKLPETSSGGTSAGDGGTAETKDEETKTKKVEDADKQSNVDNVTKSKVTVASSLINLFKPKNEEGLSDEGAAGFSLLDQFDKSGNSSEPRSTVKDQGKPAAPLSALFKASSGRTDMNTSQGSDNDSEDSSSDDEDSEEEEDDDEDSEENASEEDEDESDDGNSLIEEAVNKTKPKKSVSMSDLLDNQSESDQNDSEDELESDKGELDDEGNDRNAKLNKADPLDIRYTKEKWLERWKEMRPAIVRIYKRKHKDAVKNKKTQNEMKRRKEFTKNTKRFAWFKHKK